MVIAFHATVKGDVLFDYRSTHCHRRDRHFNAPFMPGIANRCIRQFPQPFQVAKVHILERCGVRGIAVQQDVVRPFLLQVTDAGADLQFAGHAGGTDQRFARGCQLTDQRVVGEVRGGHLETLHAPAVELLQAGFIPGGAERHQSLAGGVVETSEQLVVTQLEPFQQI